MANHKGTGKARFHCLDELPKGFLLLGRACVGRLTGFVEATLVAHTDAVPVVILAMGTDLIQGTSRLYRAVTTHHVVVTDALPASGPVPSVDVLGGALLAGLDCGAVYDY